MTGTIIRKNYTITQTHIDKIHTLLDAGLVAGLGKPIPGEMCVEAAICYAIDLPHGDDPGCELPSLRGLKIELNDSKWSSNKARADGMRSLAIAQLGSLGTVDEAEFIKRLTRMTIQTVIPQAFRVAAKCVVGIDRALYLQHALVCENEPTAENADTAEAAARELYAHTLLADGVVGAAARAAYAYARLAAARAANTDVIARTTADNLLAVARTTVHAARNAAWISADFDASLAGFAERVVQILIDMEAPGCAWLYVGRGESKS